LYRISREIVGAWRALCFLTLIMSMPFFIQAATWTHPDMMMLFFLVATLQFLLLRFRKRWLFWASFCFGLAVGVKFQAIMMAPLLGLVLLIRLGEISFFRLLKGLLLSIGSVFSGYLLCNPHILHPRGRELFGMFFRENMLSNATNHGTGLPVTVATKFYAVLLHWYYSPLFVVVIIMSFAVSLMYGLRKKNRRIFFRNNDVWIALSVTLGLNFLILFGSVQKNWPHYYLVVSVFLSFSLFLFKDLLSSRKLFLVGFGLLLGSQFLFLWPQIKSQFWDPETVAEINRQQAILAPVMSFLNPRISILMSGGVPLNVWRAGLNYEDAQVLYGTFSLDHTDPPHLYDLIFFNKKDVYFRPELQVPYVDQSGLLNALTEIDLLRSGFLGYRVVLDTPEFLVFLRQP